MQRMLSSGSCEKRRMYFQLVIKSSEQSTPCHLSPSLRPESFTRRIPTELNMHRKLVDYTQSRGLAHLNSYGDDQSTSTTVANTSSSLDQQFYGSKSPINLPRFSEIDNIDWMKYSAERLEAKQSSAADEKVDFFFKIVPKEQRSTSHSYTHHEFSRQKSFRTKSSSIFQGINLRKSRPRSLPSGGDRKNV